MSYILVGKQNKNIKVYRYKCDKVALQTIWKTL